MLDAETLTAMETAPTLEGLIALWSKNTEIGLIHYYTPELQYWADITLFLPLGFTNHQLNPLKISKGH